MSDPSIRIGTAGWAIPSAVTDQFPQGESHLARYAQRLSAVEINTSFYRPHQAKTYARWAATVPEAFRFSVKLPKTITHERRLIAVGDLLQRFLDETAALGAKLGPVLIQLPPSLVFEPIIVDGFFEDMRQRFQGQLACEPRHASWFTDAADAMLVGAHVARVAADPSISARAATPGGWKGLSYRRLHGAPKIYYSDYPSESFQELAAEIASGSAGFNDWCILDNTALGHATSNALYLQGLITAADETS